MLVCTKPFFSYPHCVQIVDKTILSDFVCLGLFTVSCGVRRVTKHHSLKLIS